MSVAAAAAAAGRASSSLAKIGRPVLVGAGGSMKAADSLPTQLLLQQLKKSQLPSQLQNLKPLPSKLPLPQLRPLQPQPALPLPKQLLPVQQLPYAPHQELHATESAVLTAVTTSVRAAPASDVAAPGFDTATKGLCFVDSDTMKQQRTRVAAAPSASQLVHGLHRPAVHAAVAAIAGPLYEAGQGKSTYAVDETQSNKEVG